MLSNESKVVREFNDLFGSIWLPFRALVVGLLGAYTAYLWFDESRRWIGVAIVFVGISLGYVLDAFGTKQLPNHPGRSVFLLEFWILAPIFVGVGSAAAVTVLAVPFSELEKSGGQSEQLVKAVSGGLSGFFVSGFIAWLGDQDDSRLSNRIRRKFQEHYKREEQEKNGGKKRVNVRHFKADSRGDLLVHSDMTEGIEGWGWPARWERARRIAQELSISK